MNGSGTSDVTTDAAEAGRLSLAIEPRPIAALPADVLHRIDRLAAEIRASDPRIGDLSRFGAGVRKGIGAGPCVWFGDTAEIPLLADNPGKRFDYRLGWLAQDRDVVVIGGPRSRAFEDYQRRHLGAPDIRYLNVDPGAGAPRRATPAICLRDPAAFGGLCDALVDQGDATLHAHITTGTIWALAARLNQASGTDVFVAGSPPLMSRRANDKIWFGSVAQRLLGTGATSPKRTAHSLSALTRHLAALARKWDLLVVKVPNSAGSAGNFLFRSEDIRALSHAALYRCLIRDLSINGRAPVFPMLVEVWDADVRTSPSVQTWIPDPADGPPIIEELFEQVLHGDQAAFAGTVPCSLAASVQEKLTQGALQLATLFQQLGYFGRCSFDALVIGANGGLSAIHWIECNGRWGGASIPMSLMRRLSGAAARPHYVVLQHDDDGFRALDFADALREFADVAPPPDLRSGILFLSPNMMETGSGCHFLAFGSDMEAAQELARRTVRRLRKPSTQSGDDAAARQALTV